MFLLTSSKTYDVKYCGVWEKDGGLCGVINCVSLP